MDTLLSILRVNENVVYFVYGQVFFTVGLVAALQSRGSRKRSRLPLAGHLGWLAGFGITHGLHEWGNVFIPIQAAYLPPSVIAGLIVAHWGLLSLSFLLLWQFGVLVTLEPSSWRQVLRLAPLAVLGSELAVFWASGGTLDATGIDRLEGWTRFALLLPSALLAGYGIFRHVKLVEALALQPIARFFRLAAASLGAYAVSASVVVPPMGLLSDHSSGRDPAVDFFAISILALRSLAGLGIAIGIGRGLEVFEVETNRLLEAAERRRLKEEVQSQLLKRAIAAQEDERRRVARELHDETGQGLSAVIMGLGAARETLERDTHRAGEIMEETRGLAVSTLQGVREIILGLRPATLDDLGLLPALRRLADDIARRADVEIQLDGSGLTHRLPTEVETVLFRIVQEGLNNLGRHAAARHARLRLRVVDGEVHVRLADDGVGFDPASVVARPEGGRGLGLLGMQERAALLGGEVVIHSKPGRGTRLFVRLPIGQPLAAAGPVEVAYGGIKARDDGR